MRISDWSSDVCSSDLLGIGTGALVPLATDADARVTTSVLATALQASNAPAIVVLDAADLNVGATDPFADLIPIARAAGAWVPVDVAFGLWARASPRHGEKLTGVEHPPSWAPAQHKWRKSTKNIDS